MSALKLSSLSDEDFERVVKGRRERRMQQIDALSPAHRTLVNDYGYHVVKTLMDHGVTKAATIRHIVEVILDEFSPTRGSFSAQGSVRHG